MGITSGGEHTKGRQRGVVKRRMEGSDWKKGSIFKYILVHWMDGRPGAGQGVKPILVDVWANMTAIAINCH